MRHRVFLCLFLDKTKRQIKSCVCGTRNEIQNVIKKLIHSSKGKEQSVFWRVV